MSVISRLGKRVSAQVSYIKGDDYDFSQKVIEVAAERLDNKIDRLIRAHSKGQLAATEVSFNLSAMHFGIVAFEINKIDDARKAQVEQATAPIIAKANENGIDLSISTSEGWHDSEGGFPSQLTATVSPM